MSLGSNNPDRTYEYTWEDFESIVGGCSVSDPNSIVYRERVNIINYFIDHPKELAENGVFKRHGYSEEDIVKILKGKMMSVITF